MKFDALCDFVEEELLDIKKRLLQAPRSLNDWLVVLIIGWAELPAQA